MSDPGTAIRHIALFVPDLQAAEAYYRALFDMSIITREALMDDELWYSLPPDKGWDDVKNARLDLDMVALQHGVFVLALFAGDSPPGQVYAIGLSTTAEEIAGIRSRLPSDAVLLEDQPEALSFLDAYQITWQISSGRPFRSIGEISGRWLEV